MGVVLRCVVLRCVVLCCVVLCSFVLRCVVLCCVVLCCVVLCCVALCCVVCVCVCVCVCVKIIGSIHIFSCKMLWVVCAMCAGQKNRENPYFFFQEAVGRVCGVCDVCR